VAQAEIQEIDRLISAGWRPKIWGAEEKLIEPLLIAYEAGLLSERHSSLLRFLVVKEKFLRIGKELGSLEESVLRDVTRNPAPSQAHPESRMGEREVEPERIFRPSDMGVFVRANSNVGTH